MKKILVTFFSVIIAISFSSVVLAANSVAQCTAKITKQVTLSEEDPLPAPDPDPDPDSVLV